MHCIFDPSISIIKLYTVPIFAEETAFSMVQQNGISQVFYCIIFQWAFKSTELRVFSKDLVGWETKTFLFTKFTQRGRIKISKVHFFKINTWIIFHGVVFSLALF